MDADIPLPGTSNKLIESFDAQEKTFSAAFAILREAIAARAFPAASVAVTHRGRLFALKSFGTFRYPAEGDFESLPPSPLFDLASLTKVVATTTMAAILYERGLLELDALITGTVPEFRSATDPRRGEVTFRMLLAHSSGLPAYEKLFLKAHARDELLQAAFTVPLTAAPGTRAEYSDIGFIILGEALERLAEEPLDIFCGREVFGPLAMSHTAFNPPKEMRNQIAPTADERAEAGGADASRSTLRNRIIQGEVQDENAWILGGVAGHAGLFSDAADLARFAHAMIEGGTPILRPETVALFTRREPAPPGTARALGWDTPSAPSQSGTHFGPGSYGHLGYTGTSLWIDSGRKLSVTLLTNRTWPDCSNPAIKQVRPKFHNAICEALEEL
ncbi:MAG TPA: serine hydrolase domain-containing protein [Candidatus Sulfotelmatobacter sp.]|nr:serine hydrolase domain-containing protein [Candidatus Sulfotelmatobacter sp.]